MSDATDENAPADLKADAATVRKWLGADETGEIKRAQHEKFARGFERYLMEGVAPSRALAKVFAQFKDWLTKIYQTVAKLKSPINDDIRAVFDRMLSSTPERVVIAPELERGKGFADIHEADAEHTPPEKAAPVADNVRSEYTTIAKEKVPDVAAKFPDAAAAETGGEPPADANPPGGADGAEPVAGGHGAVAEPGALGAGGNEAPGEGGGIRGTAGEGSRSTARGSRTDEPAGPNEPFGTPETDLVDKAGNIRLDNLGTPEDVNEVIRQTAADNGDFLGARRGVISDAQALDLADALGMDAGTLNLRKIGEAFNAEQIIAARKLLIQSATSVRDLAAKAVDGSDADVMAYAEAAARHRMIQEQVSGITAEAGRALRAFRALEGSKQAAAIGDIVQDATGRTLFQLRSIARKVANLDTPGQISKFERDAQRSGVFDWIQSVFINALISGPLTHAGYTAAGEIFALFRAVGETGASAAVGKLREIAGLGEQEYAHIAEMPHQLYGMLRGGRSGVKAAWQAIKANHVVLPEEVVRQRNLPDTTGQTVNPRETIPNPTIAGVKVPVGAVLESPGRLVAALHSFNWTTFYSQSIAGQAFRHAMKEKLEGRAFADRVAELTQSPTDQMIEEASMDANGGALMQRPAYDSMMGLVSRLTNYGFKVPDLPLPGGKSIPMGTLRPLKYIDPFVQIQANIQKAAFGRGTPLALFSQTVRDDLSMKNGGAAFDRTAGRIIAGTGFMIAAGGLAAEGLLNHSGPSEPKQAREWQRIHGLPHGLRIGDLTYDVLRLGNLGLQMSVAADLYHAASQIGKEDASKVSSDLVYAFAQNIVDESSMRGPAQIMRAIDDHDRYGAAWIRNFVSSAGPFSVGLGQVARQIDPYSRQARTTMDAIKAKIPFVSETLMPRRDVWGEPAPNRGWFGTYNQKVLADPVDEALYSLGIYPGQPTRNIRGVELTDQQYDDFSRISGRMAKMRLDAMVRQPGWSSLPAGIRTEQVNSIVSKSREGARSLIMMESVGSENDIVKKAIEAKSAYVHGGKEARAEALK
jgi:hypothetical protein